MNCQPGDLAVVETSNPLYNGRIVEVLYAPPSRNFTLPDGYPASAPKIAASWVLRFIGAPVTAPLRPGENRRTFYGVGRDAALRPLRGDPDALELITEDSISGVVE